jgi:hypothetical protein
MAKRDKEPHPPDPELAPLVASFEQGDFVRLGEQLPKLPEAASKSPRAEQLRHAVSIDPAHAVVLALSALGLLAVALYYLS